jgi:hypothetical protein
MERIDQRMNLHRIILRRQVPVEGNISRDFTTQKVSFPYNPSGCPDARVRTPSSETQSSEGVRTAQRTRTTKNIPFAESPDAY